MQRRRRYLGSRSARANPPAAWKKVTLPWLEDHPYRHHPWMRKFVTRLEEADDDATIMKLKKQLQNWLEDAVADEATALGESPSAADINRALLMGTLGIGDSGIAVIDVPGTIAEPGRVGHGVRRRPGPGPTPREQEEARWHREAVAARRQLADRDEPHRVGPRGTVISGTLRVQDLIPAFYAELERVAPTRRTRLENEMEAWRVESEAGETDPEEDEQLVQLLVDELNAVAPHGVYFGAHPGDGSDFGWWEVEDDEPPVRCEQCGVDVDDGAINVDNLPFCSRDCLAEYRRETPEWEARHRELPTADENLERLEQRLIAREEGRTRPPGAFAYRMFIRGNRAQAINDAERRGFTIIESRALPDDAHGTRAGVDAWITDGDAAQDWFGARRGRETRPGTLLYYEDLDESNASVERLTHEITGDSDRELLGRVRREMLDRHNPFAAGLFDRMLSDDAIPEEIKAVQYIEDESFVDLLEDCQNFQRDNAEDLDAFYSTHIQPYRSENHIKSVAGECFWVARNHLDDGDNPFDDEYTSTAVVERLFENAREYPVFTITTVGDLIYLEDREIAYDDLDDFVRAYIDAALWSTNDESTPAGGVPLDQNYGPGDIALDTLRKMLEDCVHFRAQNAVDLRDHRNDEQAGRDFWLTRNGHGTGFWDRDIGGLGDRLAAGARSFGEFNLIVGDDGMIHH